MHPEKAKRFLTYARSLAAIQEKHGLLVIYGPIPPYAQSYDVTELLSFGGHQPQPARSGLGYGVLFDARDTRAVVQFGDAMRILLVSDIFDHYTVIKTGLPNAPKQHRESYWAESGAE